MIRLDIRRELLLPPEEERELFRVVKGAFSQRRKTLQNTLSSSLKIGKAQVAAALEQIGQKPTARAEELSLEEFIKLAKIIA